MSSQSHLPAALLIHRGEQQQAQDEDRKRGGGQRAPALVCAVGHRVHLHQCCELLKRRRHVARFDQAVAQVVQRIFVVRVQRQRLAELIDQYRLGLVPLVVPVTMLKHHFANKPNAYIDQQTYMAPYPDELKLRNLV